MTSSPRETCLLVTDGSVGRELAALRVSRADLRCVGADDWASAGTSPRADGGADWTLAALRVLPGGWRLAAVSRETLLLLFLVLIPVARALLTLRVSSKDEGGGTRVLSS